MARGECAANIYWIIIQANY